uniref:Fe2OG dioxygenase domain-containing protein n=1 Tax=Eutreptiella gymnastica TaxID=73025 RepID=A0A7S1IRI9_9EUGL|mmetsp:Transcript_37938/g.67843  ORF Transcript_37938/g.67843 Transcript_37938/m.67843 type:complete len:340 (+) Transcript_37938:23-1042(+)
MAWARATTKGPTDAKKCPAKTTDRAHETTCTLVDDPSFRSIVGYFQHFYEGNMVATPIPSPSFVKHIMLELPLTRNLAKDALDTGLGAPIIHAFILRRRLRDALNPALEALALELEQVGGGMQVSNRGGFHSARDLFASRPGHRALQRLRVKLAQALVEAETAEESSTSDEESDTGLDPQTTPTSSWPNVNRAGHFNGMHDHIEASWSGVYYVRVPQKPKVGNGPHSGTICFRTAVGGFGAALEDRAYATNPAQPEGWCSIHHLDPSPGLLLLFPGWLMHGVMPLVCDDDGDYRVSLAFNFGEDTSPDLPHPNSGSLVPESTRTPGAATRKRKRKRKGQ